METIYTTGKPSLHYNKMTEIHPRVISRARPSYQPAALSYIRQNLRGEAPLNVAECVDTNHLLMN